MRPKPHIHARDHEHGGADTIRIHYEDVGDGAGGGGDPGLHWHSNDGDWLEINASTDINLNVESDIVLSAHDATYGTSRIQMGLGSGQIDLKAKGPGGVAVDLDHPSAQLIVYASGSPVFSVGYDGSLNGTTGQSISFDGSGRLVVYSGGTVVFRVDADGSLHGKTGKSLVFDL